MDNVKIFTPGQDIKASYFIIVNCDADGTKEVLAFVKVLPVEASWPPPSAALRGHAFLILGLLHKNWKIIEKSLFLFL